jgi:23S rRNA (guanine2445-N2)-methyltransferase / 23S rRNA (guanine2069-N7)-methyltransferase
MCGSGTLLIEAADMVCGVAPGMLRERFGFSTWLGHDADLWQRLIVEARASERRDGAPLVRGYDHDPAAVRAALENIERAHLKGIVHVERRDLAALTREAGRTGLLVTNPPYGQRLGEVEGLRGLYASLGEQLRTHFEGWQAAVFTGNPPLARELGIEARRSHTLFNGQIECRLLRFDVQSARYHSLIARERQARSQEAAAQARAELRAQPGAQMFANRLQKNLTQGRAWARKSDVDCYRVYDADMPEYAFAIDLYGDGSGQQWAYVQEYAPPAKVNPAGASARRAEVLAVIPEVLGLERERIFERTREPQRGSRQYEKVAAEREFQVGYKSFTW